MKLSCSSVQLITLMLGQSSPGRDAGMAMAMAMGKEDQTPLAQSLRR